MTNLRPKTSHHTHANTWLSRWPQVNVATTQQHQDLKPRLLPPWLLETLGTERFLIQRNVLREQRNAL